MSNAGDVDLGVEVSKGLVGKFVQAAVGFAGTVLFARLLGPVEFGGFYLLLRLVEVIDRPIVGGWAGAVKKRLSEAGVDDPVVVGSQVLFTLVITVLVGTTAFLLREHLVAYTGLRNAPVLFLAMFVPVAFFYPFQDMVIARGLLGRAIAIGTLRSVASFALRLLLVLAGLGGAGMALGYGGATLLVLPVLFLALGTWPALPDRAVLSSVWAFARHSIPNSMVGQVFERYDVLLLGWLLGEIAAADYTVAMTLTLPGMFVASTAATGLMPKVSNLASRERNVGEEVSDVLAFVSVLSVPIFFGALALPRSLVVVTFGGEYADAAVLLVGLGLYRVVETQSRPLRSVINGLDRPDLTLRISGSSLLLNVVAGYLLVLEMGAVGVVVATVGAGTLRYVLSFAVVGRELPEVDLLPHALFEQLAAGLVMFGVVVAADSLVSTTSVPTLLAVVGLGGVTYFGTLLVASQRLRSLALQVGRELPGTVRALVE
jgi:O-antigen/teichoic acid export membrane protein